MRLSPGTCGALLAVALFTSPAAAAPLSFGDFVTSAAINAVEGQNQTIGFAYAGNKFVGSVYFGNNNNQLYSTNLSGVGPNREIGTGSEAGGAVWRVSNGGTSQAQFAGAGIVGGVRSLAFDPY